MRRVAADGGARVDARRVDAERTARVFTSSRRHLLADGVDHATERALSIEERHRAAHHLDLLDGERVNGNRVITARGGHVRRARAVFEDQDAIPTEAADDRVRCCRSKRRRRDARLVCDRSSERALKPAIEIGPSDDAGGTEHASFDST